MNDREWVKEFINLYFSTNEKEITKALKLKEMYFPKKLYRYRPAVRENELQGNIYLSHQTQLNDPYDSCSVLQLQTASKLFDYCKNNIQKIFKKKYKDILDENTLKEIFERQNWYRDLLKSDPQISALPQEEQDKIIQAFEQFVLKNFESMNEWLNKINHLNRIACFTERNNNSCMWHFYANGHSGLCLEYEFTDQWKKYVFPVYYVSVLPDMIDFLYKTQNLISPDIGGRYCLIQKLLDWRGEEEWRFIASPKHFIPIDDEFDFTKNEGVLIEFFKPSRVFLGAQISEKQQKEVILIAQKYNIPIQKMKCTQYGLKAFDIE